MTFSRQSPAEQEQRNAARKAANLSALCLPSRAGHRATMAGGVSGQAIAKGVKAKPGKRPQNAAEKRWIGAIVAHGCVACWADGHGYVPPEVHHILRGGVRLGHLYTIPLCAGHHRKNAGVPGLTARHPDKALFERRYGHEIDLHTQLQVELGFTPEWKKSPKNLEDDGK